MQTKKKKKKKKGSKISDKISIESMLAKFNLLSVNRLSAQIKLKEVRKSLNCLNYPTKLATYNRALVDGSHALSTKENRIFNNNFRLQKTKSSFNINAARLWNSAPQSVRNAITNYEAKKGYLGLCKESAIVTLLKLLLLVVYSLFPVKLFWTNQVF